ncbi:hypothetical protein OESDEN_07565 [Oesophagostomum dentatum]|uniref:Uncharacterized protein n=1 Tax=Oesophagostomum dentatum TaxID=61180 RepID=A0A0B1T8R8_OESDE|nr:hypothetical protein OESDEN_07565 [Oesophagostomum dentatum]
MSTKSKEVVVKAGSTLQSPKKAAVDPKKKSDITQKTAVQPPPKSQMACATQAETLVPQPPVEKAKAPAEPTAPKETEKPKTKSAEKEKRDRSAKARHMLSNPIVTPVTDEFPTEDNPEEQDKAEGKPDGVSKSNQPTKTDKAKSYVAKRNAKAALKNVSNPIVTPVTDEFPTEDEQNGPEKKSEKPEENKGEQQASKEGKEEKEGKQCWSSSYRFAILTVKMTVAQGFAKSGD